MLDRIAYTAMTGAKHTMGQLANTAHNMANVHTPGFREVVTAFRAVPLEGEQSDSRAFVVDSTPTAMFNPGPIESTDNPFDFAIQGQGFSRCGVPMAVKPTPVMVDFFVTKMAFSKLDAISL